MSKEKNEKPKLSGPELLARLKELSAVEQQTDAYKEELAEDERRAEAAEQAYILDLMVKDQVRKILARTMGSPE